ncbi:hypothetical protein BDW22DRAFT_1326411, partial [Trametopsis cervina]
QAVLLLRPTVPLYSTDALPINCSAQAMTANSPPTPAQASSDVQGSSVSSISDRRTCECLTQTLWCHGCGASVGYMIVVPCIRCTSSTTATNRTTNGHRFVFYSGEIVASERHHVAGESGIVVPAFSPRLSSSLPNMPSGATASLLMPSTPTGQYRDPGRGTMVLSASRGDNFNVLDPPVSPSSPNSIDSPPPLIPVTPPPRVLSHSRAASGSNPQGLQPLKPGDFLYWHQLVRSGEIPAVVDDPRARNPDMHPEDELPPPKFESGIIPQAPRRRLAPVAGR